MIACLHEAAGIAIQDRTIARSGTNMLELTEQPCGTFI